MEQEVRKGIFGVLTAALMSIMVALIVGGSTWYVMDQKVKKADEMVGDLNKRVVELEKKSEDPKTTPTAAPIKDIDGTNNKISSKSDMDEIRGVCNQPSNADSELKSVLHLSNVNGDYARCVIGAKVGGGGASIILKKIDNKWAQLWAGNGSMKDEDIVKYKIPGEIYPNDHSY